MAETASVPPPTARPTRGRSIAAVICLILAAILTVPASFAYWGQRTINDGQRYVATVGPLVNSPEVQAAIATKVTDAIESQVDVEAMLNQVFAGVIKTKPRLQALVGPLAGAVNGLIESPGTRVHSLRRLRGLLGSGQHQGAGGAGPGAEGGRLGGGVHPGRAARPRPLRRHRPGQATSGRPRAHDRRRTPRRSPTENRQIVLLEAPQLNQLQNIYAFANPVAKWLLLVVAVAYLAAFLLSRRRPRMTVIIGVAPRCERAARRTSAVDRPTAVRQPAGGHGVRPSEQGLLRPLLAYLERGQRRCFSGSG